MIAKENLNIVRQPIRLMFGIGNNMVQGFSIVSQMPDGSPHWLNVWFEDGHFDKVIFIDDGQSELIYEEKEEKSTGFFGGEKRNKKRQLKEIRIRKDFQFKA